MSKKSVAPSRGYQFAVVPTQAVGAPVSGILLDPAQTTDDMVEKVTENSPAFTLLASRCTLESDFSNMTMLVYSYAFAIPHLLQTDATTWADDNRGAIVELLRTGVSFRNTSKSELTLHANTPIATQGSPDKVYARLSGFYKAGKGGKMADDVHLKPGQTASYKINWKNLPNEYTPMMEAKNGRYWMNLLCFCVEIQNINQETGAAFNNMSSVLSMIPKATYTKRKSNPLPSSEISLTYQDDENFALQSMAGGAVDLFSVYPISVQDGTRSIPGAAPLNRINSSHEIFGGDPGAMSFTQQAAVEGDLLGIQRVNVTKLNYLTDESDLSDAARNQSYIGTGLVVKRVGGKDRPLELSSRQSSGTRVIVVGLTVDATPSNSAMSYSSFKWDPNVGYWVLWDDFEQAPRYASNNLTEFTPVSAYHPLLILSGVYTLQEKEDRMKALQEMGKNAFGQPFGDPRGFGTFLKKAIGVVSIISQVAAFAGTLL